MIKSFRSRALRAFYEREDPSRVQPKHLKKLNYILDLLNACDGPAGVQLPSLRLHRLHGRMQGHYAVEVSGNWRVTFRFNEDGDAVDINYVDYH